MVNTTLCYIEQDGKYLMLQPGEEGAGCQPGQVDRHRGKFEDGESPEDCILREVREETGLTMTDFSYRGLVTFVSDRWPTEYMHLFRCTGFAGDCGHLPGGGAGVD